MPTGPTRSGTSWCGRSNKAPCSRVLPTSIRTLRKIPFDFYYRYRDPDGTEWRHKIVDWEAGALYWNLQRTHGAGWQAPFRSKIEKELPAKDLMFLMGTVHRFPEQWLIVSLIYPPMRRQQMLL